MWFSKATFQRPIRGEVIMNTKFISKIFFTSLCFSLILMFSGEICSAAMGKRFTESEYKLQHKKSTESITGEISQVRGTYVGILTKQTKPDEETEMLFIVDEDVNFKRKSLAELKEGDIIKITYENITESDPDDAEKDKFVQRVTKEIHFLRPKSKSLRSGNE